MLKLIGSTKILLITVIAFVINLQNASASIDENKIYNQEIIESPLVCTEEEDIENIEETDEIIFMAEAIGDSELGEIRGTFTVSDNNAVGLAILEGAVAHNNVASSATGNNELSQTAFDNAAGVVTVIQNTGNNVLIQNATVVNFVMNE